MVFLNLLSLLVTAFVVAYFSFFSKKSDHSLSFFLCVSICMFIANLLTASAGGGAYYAAIGYLIVDVIFLGLAFAVNAGEAVDCYKEFAVWGKRTFVGNQYLVLQLLSFFIFPAGIVLYFINYKKDNAKALTCGKCALWGIVFWASLIWFICGVSINPAPEAPNVPDAQAFLKF